MNKHASQPRAIYYVVALQIWEYFSFYGMRALRSSISPIN